ncbi:MAG: FIG domain-containing protein [Planctomycetota bacterium]
MTSSESELLARLIALEDCIASAVRKAQALQSTAQLSQQARDPGRGDTIFGIDVAAEEALLAFCEDWGQSAAFRLVAEGIQPDGGRVFGGAADSRPEFVVIVDPVDGSRGLMFDKRNAWCLAAVAPERGPETCLTDVTVAVMTELPTKRQGVRDQLWATSAGTVHGERTDLFSGDKAPLAVAPATATDLRHGFATVVNYFPGGKELTARIEEEILRAEMGGWNPEKAEVYSDQYISAGGQLAELALGRDRFVLDIRPLVHKAIGVDSSLCARPYDICTALVAQRAGCIVTAPDGSPLNPPLDITTNVAFVAYANQQLADRLQPIVNRVLRTEPGSASK